MKRISVLAELLYIVSNFEKGRIKSFGIWRNQYKKSFQKSLEIMVLLTNVISTKKEISQAEMIILQSFIHENNGVIFSGEKNISSILSEGEEKDFDFSYVSYEDAMKLMNDIIAEIQNLLQTKVKNYKVQISYLLRAFHNLPKVFINPNDITAFNLGIQPITQQEAIHYANSYLLMKEQKTNGG